MGRYPAAPCRPRSVPCLSKKTLGKQVAGKLPSNVGAPVWRITEFPAPGVRSSSGGCGRADRGALSIRRLDDLMAAIKMGAGGFLASTVGRGLLCARGLRPGGQLFVFIC